MILGCSLIQLTLNKMLSKISGQNSTRTIPDITVKLPSTVITSCPRFRTTSLYFIFAVFLFQFFCFFCFTSQTYTFPSKNKTRFTLHRVSRVNMQWLIFQDKICFLSACQKYTLVSYNISISLSLNVFLLPQVSERSSVSERNFIDNWHSLSYHALKNNKMGQNKKWTCLYILDKNNNKTWFFTIFLTHARILKRI